MDNDFGFTAVDEVEINPSGTKLERMYKLITPLLENLLKNPEKEYIKWPNREKIVKSMIEELEGIMDVNKR